MAWMATHLFLYKCLRIAGLPSLRLQSWPSSVRMETAEMSSQPTALVALITAKTGPLHPL